MEGLVNLHESYNLVDILDERDYEQRRLISWLWTKKINFKIFK